MQGGGPDKNCGGGRLEIAGEQPTLELVQVKSYANINNIAKRPGKYISSITFRIKYISLEIRRVC